MEISSRFIKISGEFEIPEDLTIGRDYSVEINGSITAQVDSDESDGTLSRQFKYRPITGQIRGENGVTVGLRDPRKKSVKFRAMIMHGWEQDYDTVMDILLAHGDELKEWVEKHVA